jgi:hypothetical protein
MIDTNTIMDKKIKDLESMKLSIDTMSKMNHLEILKILNDNNVKINENKSGVYINLSFLHDDVVKKIEEFVNLVQQREILLEVVEQQKIELSSSINTI